MLMTQARLLSAAAPRVSMLEPVLRVLSVLRVVRALRVLHALRVLSLSLDLRLFGLLRAFSFRCSLIKETS